MKALCRVLALLALLVGVHAATAVDAQTRIWFYAQSGTFRPEAPVRVDIYASHEAAIEAALVPLSTADVVALEKGANRPALLDLVRDRRAAATIRTRIAATSDKDGNHRADFGRQRPGFYAFRLRARGELAGAQLLAVTSIGFVLVDTGAGPAAYALDLRTMRPRGDVTFDRYSSSGEHVGTTHAGADGLATFEDAAGTDTTFVIASGGDAAAVMRSGSWFDDSTRRAGYVQTDRPIYRPGDRVYYRAVARTGAPGAYAVPTGTAIVTIRDPAWKELISTTPRFDTFGTVAGELQLAEDATLGQYRISVWGTDATFAVEAYKKPEYVVDVAAPRFVVGGDAGRFGISARYFFGRPAAGMRLHYRASFRDANAWWRRGSPFGFSGTFEPAGRPLPADIEGDLIADAAGRATVVVPTTIVENEKVLDVEVDARDATGRTVTAGTRTGVTPASFYLTIGPRRYFVAAGDALDLDVRSLQYGTGRGRGSAVVTVAFARDSWVDGSWRHEELPAETVTVTTDAAGKATVQWKPPASGSFVVTARTRDERGRAISNRTYVWVAAQRYDRAYAFGGVTVVPQSSEYAPGRRATVLVTVPQGDVDALVQVTGGKHDQVFVRHLPTQATALEIEPPADVAHYDVTVYVPTANGMQSGRAQIDVAAPPHRLRVTIASARAKYAPGDRASFAIRVAGPDGAPVRAQIGLGVVDDAIFALREASNADPFDAFYGPSVVPWRAETTSWSSLDAMTARIDLTPLMMMIGRTQSRSATGAFQPAQTADMYTIGAPTIAAVAPPLAKPAFDKLRNDFRDTAYWSPAVVTGADGRATVTFRWPDSLTSFTANGVAVSQGTDVGRGTGAALVTKDFLVRLGAPRFLRRGDAARITAIAQGTLRAKTAMLRFSAPALGVADETTAVRFDAHASANARWDVHGGELGPSLLRLAGTSGALSDGLQMKLLIESALSPERVRAAGSLPAEPSVALDLPRGGEAGALRIDLAPSMLAQLVADVQLLQVYPYFCVEQTMSAALPAVQVDRLRSQMSLPPIQGPEPGDVAKRAVNRLVKLQHGDGSWGWWENDAANPFMTAYALYGLTELARGGFAVPQETLDRGVASLVRQIAAPGDTLAFWGGAQSGSEWNTRAFMLYALADAKPDAVDRKVLAAADAQAKKMNPYALAALGLAHLELSDRSGAEPLLAELRTRVTDEKTSVHWQGASWHYRWMDDPIETTAYAVRFVHAMAPSDPLVLRAVTWLRAQQHGSWFETTKDTAAAIAAIAEVVPVSPDELNPHETIRVTLNGRELKRVRIDTAVLPLDGRSISVPPALVRRGGTLRFEREGTGGLAWSTEWLRYVHERTGVVAETPFRITRLYASERGNTWRVGDQVDVDVTVTATGDSQYVAIEDPLPAGLEYQPRQHESGDDWSGLQFFDDRVLFFATRVSANRPLHFRYTLRATTAGTFTAPAPSAYAMYGPPNTSTGLSATVTIR